MSAFLAGVSEQCGGRVTLCGGPGRLLPPCKRFCNAAACSADYANFEHESFDATASETSPPAAHVLLHADRPTIMKLSLAGKFFHIKFIGTPGRALALGHCIVCG